ncbi:MAG: proline racemase family protein, partial [Rubrivivax sp.]|nr:proline racemase family protein [Rubrivivax sp.]
MPNTPARLIDSHTGGEPTRLLVSGGPDLGRGSMAERLRQFRQHHEHWRRALVNEPRGNDVLVGALLCEPVDPASACGVIFFNNVGYLGMCGHGTIGLVATLLHLGRLVAGQHRIETPVGTVQATLHGDGSVTVANVPAFRHARQVAVDVPGHGRLHGDVAWGGNWFFLCHDHGLTLLPAHVAELTACADAVRLALVQQGITGEAGAAIDHIELLGPAQDAALDPAFSGRSFVLCPGGAYDRSPCGTGTSAKLACLAADGVLAPGQKWHQESVIGSVFTGHYLPAAVGDVGIQPFIHGRAHVTLDATVV